MADESMVEIPVDISNKGICRTITELILYKMDRTIAICGLIAIGIVALSVKVISPTASTVISLIAGGLTTYIGGKITK